MIYLDTSVLLATLLVEDRRPDPSLWEQPLVSSRLLQYETWTRLHARNLEGSHGDAARDLVGRVSLLALSPEVLARALEPFPVPVRTLDGLEYQKRRQAEEQRVARDAEAIEDETPAQGSQGT